MKILHISAECYPAAKAGGLGDVVGALPKYLNKIGVPTGVIIPKYHTKWILSQQYTPVFKGSVRLHDSYYPFVIEKQVGDSLGFPFFVASIPGRFDRPGIYSDEAGHPYRDEVERALCFQQAVLQWIRESPGKPEVLHCHDHHTGLIPFMVKHCPEYQTLAHIPTVFTIHNGQYHGQFSWEKLYLLPFFEQEARGLLNWHFHINPMATAVKCAWRVTTVSDSYLHELQDQANGMESLLRHEQFKCAGILNGIDQQVWDPETDPYIGVHLDDDVAGFKAANKRIMLQHFRLNEHLPVITFIGRLVGEKGADLLPDLIQRVIYSGMQVAFAILGTGERWLHDKLAALVHQFPGQVDVRLEYNEGLAHQMYAGSDYLIMPSRVEPCGLNQMYAMRYGTLPVVRSVGGLKDTVPDIGEPDGSGRGIRFDHFTLDDAHLAVYRAVDFYHRREAFQQVRNHVMTIDFSWENSAGQYNNIYEEMTSLVGS
ncbi:MAG: glycogen/starch synthase [Saprospiraceae bacterium]|nr:glycogen/starch synthase [Lewinella sp.]